MITEFTLKVYEDRREEAEHEMDSVTSAFLTVAGGLNWECIEDTISPDQAWVPGFGGRGEIRGWKAFRKFINNDYFEKPHTHNEGR